MSHSPHTTGNAAAKQTSFSVSNRSVAPLRLQSQPSSKITPPKSDVVWQRSFCSFVLPASPGRGTGILSGVTPNVSPGDLRVSIVAQLIMSEDKRVLNTVRSGPEDAISSTSRAAAAHSFTTSSQLFYERLESNTSQPDSVCSRSLVSPLSLLGHSARPPACLPARLPPHPLSFPSSYLFSPPSPRPNPTPFSYDGLLSCSCLHLLTER